MVQWPRGIDQLWKELCGTMWEEVFEKYKVDEAKMVLIKNVVSPQTGGSSRSKRGINLESDENLLMVQRIQLVTKQKHASK